MRRHGLNWLRGCAAFGIVGCHLSLSPRTCSGEWATALCDFNVGLFAAIAGFLMSIDRSWGLEYVKKRAVRLLPTYLAWTAVYVVATAIFDLVLDGGRLNERYYQWSNWINVLCFGSAAAHLWFLICLFYGQVILWGLSMVMNKSLLALLSLLLLVASCLNGGWWCIYPTRLMAFLLLGYVLKGCQVGQLRWPIIATGVMVIVHLAGRGIIPPFIRDYMLAIPVLLLFASDRFRENKVAGWLAATSMGVYLIHPLFARGVSFVITRMLAPPYDAMVVAGEWVLIWMLSFGAVALMLKIPMVARWVR